MTETSSFHRDNHYVSRGYLKRWSARPEHIWTYRTIVHRADVRRWDERPIRGVAYRAHLYTQLKAGQETDEVERWLDREFEAPAEEALRRATSDAQLTREDWRCLVRFLALQHVRTPTRMVEALQNWQTTIPRLLEETMQEAVRELELAKELGTMPTLADSAGLEPIPLRVTTEIEPDQEYGNLKAKVLAGRGFWLSNMRNLLTSTAARLEEHRWTILTPPKHLEWLTSDDPVICLNFHSPGQYDFKGGWASPGTEIILPLGPRHLLYTQVGRKPPRRGETMPHADMIRRFTAEHAHRLIFAAAPDPEVELLRPRDVNPVLLQQEKEIWRNWNEEQTTAEREFMNRKQ